MFSAKEAYTKSLENFNIKMEELSKEEIEKIDTLISKACNKGEFYITVNYKILSKTKQYFESLGYNIEYYSDDYSDIETTEIKWGTIV